MDSSIRICVVCRATARNRNFGQITCESCKSFFRRNYGKTLKCSAPREGECIVDSRRGRLCSSCRLIKCHAVGMKWMGPPPSLKQPVSVRSDTPFSCFEDNIFAPPSDIFDRVGPLSLRSWCRLQSFQKTLTFVLDQLRLPCETLESLRYDGPGGTNKLSILHGVALAEPGLGLLLDFLKIVPEFSEALTLEEKKSLVVLRMLSVLSTISLYFYHDDVGLLRVPTDRVGFFFESTNDTEIVNRVANLPPELSALGNHRDCLQRLLQIIGRSAVLLVCVALLQLFLPPASKPHEMIMGPTLTEKCDRLFRQTLLELCACLRRLYPSCYQERFQLFVEWMNWSQGNFFQQLTTYQSMVIQQVKDEGGMGPIYTSILALLESKLMALPEER